MDPMLEFDDVIVGGGTAGCALAARLSEDPDRRVLLLEAGPDFRTAEETPGALLNSAVPALHGFDWGLTARTRSEQPGKQLLTAARTFGAASAGDKVGAVKGMLLGSGSPGGNMLMQLPYFVGKVVGGSSAINGCVALRPAPADVDEWRTWGGDDWSWEQVLPYFRRLEDDLDHGGEWHGRGGPIPIRRYRSDQLSPAQRGFLRACRALGHAEVQDHNHPESAPGVGVVPTNTRDGHRISTALAYLGPARHRSNLVVRGRSPATRVLFEERRAVGVEYEREGRRQQVRGRRVVLAAGAVFTPALLLRSGIGPEAELARLGVRPVAALPGVGENLIDHTAVVMWAVPRPGVCTDSEPVHQTLLRYTAARSDQTNDMHLYMMGNVDVSWLPLQHMLGCQRALGISTVLTRPYSRGRVRLASTAPDAKPELEFRCLSDPRDLPRLAEGVRLAWRIARSPDMARLIERVFIWSDAIVGNDASLHNTVRTFVSTSFHPVGTARMGNAGDPGAVVDARLRVHGVDGLRVVDASVMPNTPRFPTGLTCIMLAERAADWLRATDL
jgi:choline dehydrogenase